MDALKIFLAEDNRGDILLVKEALAKYQVPYELFAVRDGAEALRFIARMGTEDGPPCPDVILLDLNLPRANGAEVITEFRKHPQCARTPVIAMSSSWASQDQERMYALGIARYFRKPSDLDDFLRLGSLVREVVEEAGLAG